MKFCYAGHLFAGWKISDGDEILYTTNGINDSKSIYNSEFLHIFVIFIIGLVETVSFPARNGL